MSIWIIILLIILGVLLLLVEFLVIPGVTIAGIGGFALMILGVVLSYIYLGVRLGNLVLFITLVINIICIFWFLRAKTWQKAGLKSEISGKVNLLDIDLKVGDIGKTISRLAPGGKALFDNRIMEVHSLDGFIDQNKEIEIVSLRDNKIFIKLK